MDNYGSCESQQKVWRHHILQCSKVGDSELDTAISSKLKHKILYQFCLSAIIKKNELKLPKNHLGNYIFRPSVAANSIVSDSDRNSNTSKLLCMSLLPKRMK